MCANGEGVRAGQLEGAAMNVPERHGAANEIAGQQKATCCFEQKASVIGDTVMAFARHLPFLPHPLHTEEKRGVPTLPPSAHTPLHRPPYSGADLLTLPVCTYSMLGVQPVQDEQCAPPFYLGAVPQTGCAPFPPDLCKGMATCKGPGRERMEQGWCNPGSNTARCTLCYPCMCEKGLRAGRDCTRTERVHPTVDQLAVYSLL